jgi:hypothetical protein
MQKPLPIIPENADSPWHKVDPGDDVPKRFNVIIEIPMGSSNNCLSKAVCSSGTRSRAIRRRRRSGGKGIFLASPAGRSFPL